MQETKQSRKLVAAGHIPPHGSLCRPDAHVGYPMRVGTYLAAESYWHGCADCSACLSTVTLAQFQGAAA